MIALPLLENEGLMFGPLPSSKYEGRVHGHGLEFFLALYVLPGYNLDPLYLMGLDLKANQGVLSPRGHVSLQHVVFVPKKPLVRLWQTWHHSAVKSLNLCWLQAYFVAPTLHWAWDSTLGLGASWLKVLPLGAWSTLAKLTSFLATGNNQIDYTRKGCISTLCFFNVMNCQN